MKCLVTGASGFIGSYLTEFLLGRGETVYGLDQRTNEFSGGPKGDYHFVQCDILDRACVAAAIANIRPEMVFHLAAQSLPKVSWEDPETTFRVNVFGTLYLLDAIRAANINPVIEVFCSSSEYAVSRDASLIAEDYPLEPSSPYALSKIAQDQLSVLYGKAYGMHIVRVRPFFIIGPRKTGDVSSDFARGIVAIECGFSDKLNVGNLGAVRDFLDVRDAVSAFWQIAERGTPGGVYNVCAGEGQEVRRILRVLVSLTKVPIRIQEDPTFLRSLDEPVKVGDNTKLRALGWIQAIGITQALSDILEYWRG